MFLGQPPKIWIPGLFNFIGILFLTVSFIVNKEFTVEPIQKIIVFGSFAVASVADIVFKNSKRLFPPWVMLIIEVYLVITVATQL